MSETPLSYAELRAMYDAQCACTDEWAAKYEAERSRKASANLMNRIAELQSELSTVNGRLVQAQARCAELEKLLRRAQPHVTSIVPDDGPNKITHAEAEELRAAIRAAIKP